MAHIMPGLASPVGFDFCLQQKSGTLQHYT